MTFDFDVLKLRMMKGFGRGVDENVLKARGPFYRINNRKLESDHETGVSCSEVILMVPSDCIRKLRILGDTDKFPFPTPVNLRYGRNRLGGSLSKVPKGLQRK